MHPKPRAEGAHKIEPAKQVQKNREHVSRFFYFEREKSFPGTFFRPCSAKSEHILSAKPQVLRQDIKIAPPCRCVPISNLHDLAGGFSVWHVCASNIRVYPGGLLLSIKTFRSPVLKMWVKKGLLSNRAGSYRNKMLCFR